MIATLAVTGMTDAALEAAVTGAGTPEDLREAAGAEIDRREQQEQRRQRRRAAGIAAARARPDYQAWQEAMRANYDAAEVYCRGDDNMLNPAGRARGMSPERLWRDNEESARRYASDCLLTFWDHVSGRPPAPREFMSQWRAGAETCDRPEPSEPAVDAPPPAQAPEVPETAPTVAPTDTRPAEVNTPQEPAAGADGIAERVAQRAALGARLARERGARHQRFAAARAAASTAVASRPLPDYAKPSAELATRNPAEVDTPLTGAVVPAVAAMGQEPEPVDGGELLEQTAKFLYHFAVWPSDDALIAAALWVGQAHGCDGRTLLPVWPYSPKFLLLSSEGGSGKSWMARLMAKLSPRGKMLIEMTPAALVDKIAQHCTTVVDESDVLFGAGGRNPKIRALINGSYEPDQETSRMRGRESQDVPLFCPLILAGLDKMKKATGDDITVLISRCIIMHVKRAPEGYRPPRFDTPARAFAESLRDRLALWMSEQVANGIGDYVPDLPPRLGNRPAALWEPLLAVADAAGGPWPALGRQACAAIESGGGLPRQNREAWETVLSGMESYKTPGFLAGGGLVSDEEP